MKIRFHIDLAMSTFLSHKVAKTTDEVAITSAKRGKVAFLHNQRLNQNELVFLKFGSPEKFKVCSCDQDDHFGNTSDVRPAMRDYWDDQGRSAQCIRQRSINKCYVQVRLLF